MGYIRTKIHSRNILVKALIDSGNLYSDLISEELAKKLNLKIIPSSKTVGTAASSGSIQIVGRIPHMKVFLENIKRTIIVKPFVVRDLAHPLNLGQACLRRHHARLQFDNHGGFLEIKGEVTRLNHRQVTLTSNTVDSRIHTVLSTLKQQGGNPCPAEDDSILDLRVNAATPTVNIGNTQYKLRKTPVNYRDTREKVYNKNQITLKANCSTIVALTSPTAELVENNNVFIAPKYDCKFANKHSLFMHPGCYRRGSSDVNVLITNFKNTDVILPAKCHLGHKLEAETNECVNQLSKAELPDLSEKELNEWRKFIIDELHLDENDHLNANPAVKEEIIDIFLQNRDAVATTDYDYGNTRLMKFTIDIPAGTRPVRAKLRPLNPMQEADLKRQIEEWTEAGVIEPSIAPWSSALVPCKKKGTDKLRWAVDFRKINELTTGDSYPLPAINTNLDKLSGSAIFSTLDSAGAFHTMSIDENSRDYTTFTSCFGLYRFKKMPFGLKNSPSSYSRLVQMALDRLDPGFALGYIDDIIVHSKTLEEHVQHLRLVVELHSSCGMKLKMKKCHIAQDQVEYLGHLVNAEGIQMIPSYVERVLDWPLPKTGKELRSFLGFSGYYRAFIREYAHLTFEMQKMKNNKNELTWNPDTIKKFEELKECFKQAPLRGYPKYESEEPFILDTDWSATNSAAVLSQKQNGKEVFLGCMAKKNGKSEQNYPAHKGELMAFVLACRKFEHILRARPFILRTDSRCVQFLNSMKETRGIYARWQNYLAGFQFTIQHRKGTKHDNADALSRRRGVTEEAEDPMDLDDNMQDVDDIYAVNAKPTQDEISKANLKRATQQDATLKQIIQYVKRKEKPNREERKSLGRDGMCYVNIFECLSLEDGLLVFQSPTVDGQPQPKRICLPTKLYKAAFNACHRMNEAGHMGANNTYLQMKKRFYFPHLYAYISTHIQNCVPCITKKSGTNKPQHKMHHEVLSYFGQRIYSDTVGPLTGSEFQGMVCKHFLTIQDGFTRYLVAVPIPDLTTETVADAFVQNWIHVFGCPETVHTDRGTSFTSKLFQEIMSRFGITKTVTPAYTPQGNRVERVHQTLANIMRSDRQFDGREWPRKLKVATFVYNTSTNRMTGISPFEAVFGHEATMPVDMIFPLRRKEGTSWSNYIEHLKMTYQRIYQKMCDHELKVISLDAPHYQGRKAMDLQVDDIVYYFLARVTRGLSKKLQSRWIGPFRIIRKVSESLVVIKPEGTWATHKEIPTIVSRLRKVDKDLYLSELRPSKRYQVDLPAILDQVDDLDGVIGFQPDFEDDETPIAEATHGATPVITGPSINEELGEPTQTGPTITGTPEDVPPPEPETEHHSMSDTPPIKLEPENQTPEISITDEIHPTPTPSYSQDGPTPPPTHTPEESEPPRRNPSRLSRYLESYRETNQRSNRARGRGFLRKRPRGILRN